MNVIDSIKLRGDNEVSSSGLRFCNVVNIHLSPSAVCEGSFEGVNLSNQYVFLKREGDKAQAITTKRYFYRHRIGDSFHPIVTMLMPKVAILFSQEQEYANHLLQRRGL